MGFKQRLIFFWSVFGHYMPLTDKCIKFIKISPLVAQFSSNNLLSPGGTFTCIPRVVRTLGLHVHVIDGVFLTSEATVSDGV